tara:strand:- start:945 stop:1160 length:216 start_codon:yes stop_codon:yes gene_type:complete
VCIISYSFKTGGKMDNNKIMYHGIDKDGLPRVWGTSRSQCELAIEEYNATKPKEFKKSLRVVEALTGMGGK